MKIDEVIKELEVAERRAHKITAWKREDAIKLGIEALKKIKVARHYNVPSSAVLLPGENDD